MTPEYDNLKRMVGSIQRILPNVQDKVLSIPQTDAWSAAKKLAWDSFYRAQNRGTPEVLLQPYRAILLQADCAPFKISSVGKPGRPRKT